MPIAPPASRLWFAVNAAIRAMGRLDGGWPETDEDAVRTLGARWTDAGAMFGTAMARDGRPAGFVGPLPVAEAEEWPDEAGLVWAAQRTALRTDLETRQAELNLMGAHATAFADDVTYAKNAIVETIMMNSGAYDAMVTAPGGIDAGARDTFVGEIARAINAFLDEMAGFVAARQPGIAEDAAPPTVDFDSDDLDGFGAEEAADWAGVASAALGVAALASAAFPPAALVLGGASLLAGGFAAAQHTNEALEKPSAGNVATVAGDVASLVPGVGAAIKGGKLAAAALHFGGAADALAVGSRPAAEGLSSVSPLWVDAATNLGAANAPLAAKVVQAETLLGTQAPTIADLTTPGSQGEVQSTSDAATVVYGGSRVGEAVYPLYSSVWLRGLR